MTTTPLTTAAGVSLPGQQDIGSGALDEKVQPAAGSVTHIIKVRVADVDAAFARARDAGARVISEPTTYEYGERSCELEDLAGHRWELTGSVRDVQPEEWGGVTVPAW